jgi:hypothetical protein
MSGTTIPAYTISIRLTISPKRPRDPEWRRIGRGPRAGWLTTERQTVPYVWAHPDEDR